MPTNDAAKLASLARLYELVLDRTSSFEEDHIGADLAYLMGAILTGTNCMWPKDRPIIAIVEQLSDEQYACGLLAMRHIHIEEEER